MEIVKRNFLLIVKTMLFLMLVPGTVTIIIPFMIVKNTLSWSPMQSYIPQYFGLLPILAGLAICLWCFWEFINKGRGTPSPFDPPKQLVEVGLYDYVRNPMYIGISAIIFGEAILISSVPLILYLIILLMFFHTIIVYYEEPKLKAAFGKQYDSYTLSVPRWSFMCKHKK